MRVTTFFLFVSINSIVFSQEIDTVETNEFTEKPMLRHLFTMDGVFAFPLIDMVSRKYYLDESYQHFFNWGIKLSYVYSKSKRFGLGLEYDFEISKVALHNSGFYTFYSLISTDYLSIKHEGINIAVQTIMPKIEWKSRNSNRPNGFCHQFGIGLTMNNAINRNYKYELVYVDFSSHTDSNGAPLFFNYDENNAEDNYDAAELYNYKNKAILGGAVMYSITYRRRLTEKLLWSMGVRAQLNLSKAFFQESSDFYQTDNEDREFWITRREMEYIIAKNRIRSVLSMQIGLVYSL